jgi:hypothetical protein
MAAMQGAGFGGVHTFATLALMTMWGQRVQPWMQVCLLIHLRASMCLLQQL